MARFELEIKTEKRMEELNNFLTGFLSERSFEKKGKPELNEWRKGFYWIRFLSFTFSPGALRVKAWINIPYPGMGSFIKYFAGKAELRKLLKDLEESANDGMKAPVPSVAAAAPPAMAMPADTNADIASLGFKKIHVIIMILLRVITFGVYYSVWLILRAKSLNRLSSKTKLKTGVLVFILIVEALSYVFVLIGATVGSSALGFSELCIVVGFIVIEVQCFKMRRILNEYFRVHLSGPGTFFFTIYYLQHRINKFLSFNGADENAA